MRKGFFFSFFFLSRGLVFRKGRARLTRRPTFFFRIRYRRDPSNLKERERRSFARWRKRFRVRRSRALTLTEVAP